MRKANKNDHFIDHLAHFVALILYPFYFLYKSTKHIFANLKHKLSNVDKPQLNVELPSLKFDIKAKDLFGKRYFDPKYIQLAFLTVFLLTSVAYGLNQPVLESSSLVEDVPALVAEIESVGTESALIAEVSPETVVTTIEASIFEEVMAFDSVNAAQLELYSLLVNGTEIAVVDDVMVAEGILDDLKARYLTDEEEQQQEVLDAYFYENVEIVVNRKDIATLPAYKTQEEIFDYIVRGTDERRTHKVEKGESFWTIATNYEIAVSDLEKANPKVEPTRLQIGQEISLIVPKPLIGVCTVEIIEYSEALDYEIVYEDSSNLFKGEYRTKISGVKGEMAIVSEITKENGRVIKENKLEQSVVAQPVTKVVYKGTKDPPPRIGTGTFAKPTSRGYITSGFGWRWGRRHNGIDVGIPTGTAVTAADGGKVIFSGVKGGYGYCVIVDHGANMRTLYAHNSKLKVRVGDKVFKGQTIALSGNTGTSTGPHLHFEIQKNGVPVDPIKYVKY